MNKKELIRKIFDNCDNNGDINVLEALDKIKEIITENQVNDKMYETTDTEIVDWLSDHATFIIVVSKQPTPKSD